MANIFSNDINLPSIAGITIRAMSVFEAAHFELDIPLFFHGNLDSFTAFLTVSVILSNLHVSSL